MPARVVDTLDQIGNDRALGKRHEADRGAESYLLAEDRWPPQRQGDAWRTDERGIVDVLDVGERDALLLAAVLHHQRVAVVVDLVDEIEHQLLHDEVAEPDHGNRYDHNEKALAVDDADADKHRKESEPQDRKDPLVEEGPV